MALLFTESVFGNTEVADIGFKKGGGALTGDFQINGLWSKFYIKKVRFWVKRDGRTLNQH